MVGGNLHRLVINTSIDPTLTNIPDFTFSTISSNSPNTNTYGYPYLSVAQSSTVFPKLCLALTQ